MASVTAYSNGPAPVFALAPSVAKGGARRHQASSGRLAISSIEATQGSSSSSPWASWSSLAAGALLGAAALTSAPRTGAHRQRWRIARSATEASRSKLLRGLGGIGAGSLLAPVAPQAAEAKSFEEAQSALVTYGLPELAPTQAPPGGWKVIVEPIGLANDAYYGKFKLGAEPQVVTFVVPPLWVVSKPNIDFNGAAGTVQANDYGKGDSATFFVDTNFKGGNLDEMSKKEFQVELKKALTQKGKGFIEDLRVSKVFDGAPGYKLVEYSYEIESGAGFSINRNGYASVTQVGTAGNLQIFWTGTVTPRWDDMKDNLLRIVQSFRIGNVPKNVIIEKREFKRKDEEEANL